MIITITLVNIVGTHSYRNFFHSSYFLKSSASFPIITFSC